MLKIGMGLVFILAMPTWVIGLKELKATKDIKKLRRTALIYHHAMIIVSVLTMLNILFR